MSSQQFFLRWDNYSNHISYAFGTLRNQEDLVDVTLSCEGKKIRAHKVLLSACSPYFRDVFKDNPCQHPVIVFKNVRFEDLLAIVEFMYQGEVSVAQESLSSFINTAELLSVQGLTENSSSSTLTAGTLFDAMPKTVTLKTAPQQQQQQQTVTLIPSPERRYVTNKKPTTIKTVTQPITVYSPKTQPAVQPTKRFVTAASAPAPVKLTTVSGVNQQGQQQQQQQTTTTTLLTTAMGDGTLVEQPQILNAGNTGNSGQQQQLKRKRILFDSEENISIEDVNYVKQQMDMEMSDYIEIQTSTDDEKGGMVTVTAEDLIGGVESDSQAQENVIIEEAFDTGAVDDDDDEDKDKEMEITYTKDEQGNGTVVLTPVNSSAKDSDKSQQSVNIVQADGSNTKWSQCSFCKLVITSVNLWRHIRTQHTAQQPQVCQYCNKNFKNKYSLREHIRIAHEKLTTAGGGGGGGAAGKGTNSGNGGGGATEASGGGQVESELMILKAEK